MLRSGTTLCRQNIYLIPLQWSQFLSPRPVVLSSWVFRETQPISTGSLSTGKKCELAGLWRNQCWLPLTVEAARFLPLWQITNNVGKFSTEGVVVSTYPLQDCAFLLHVHCKIVSTCFCLFSQRQPKIVWYISSSADGGKIAPALLSLWVNLNH